MDLKHYLYIFVRRIWIVALCFVLSLGLAVFKLLRQVDTYESSARLLLSGGLPVVRPFQVDEMGEVSRAGGDFFATQIQILYSRALRERARELASYPPSVLDANIIGMRGFQVWMTSMLQITVISLDPVVGADYANSMARAYQQFREEQRLELSQGTIFGLMQLEGRLRQDLANAEERLLTFRKENQVLGMVEKSNLAAEAMAQLARRATALRLERLLMENQQPLLRDAPADVVLKTLATIQPSPAPSEQERGRGVEEGRDFKEGEDAVLLTDKGDSMEPSWQNLRREKEFMESELNALRRDFRDEHPKIKEILARLDEVDRKLEIEVDFAQRQFLAKLESLRILENAALRVESEWEDEALEISRKAFVFASLEREVERVRRMSDSIYDRLREVDVAASFDPGTVRIIEEALPAGSPKSPRKLRNLFLAALLGIGVGVGIIFGMEFIDDSLRYPEDTSRHLGLPSFGIVPSIEWNSDDLSSHLFSNMDRNSPMAESYRNIRSSLLFAARTRPLKSLAIISALPKEGKTTTCMNMAVSLAQAGERILLVDADLRRGAIHQYFGLEGGRGFADILVGQAKPESVVQRSGIHGLDIVATGPLPPSPAEILLRPEFHSFVDYARRNYDRILFDCAPVMAVSESAVLASAVDGVMFVVWGGHTGRKLARAAVQILQEKGANVLGCILNNLEIGRVGYYYYAGYYYDSYYGKDTRDSKTSAI